MIAEVTEFLPHNQLEQKEIDQGLQVTWVTLEKTEELLTQATPKSWEGKFI